MVLLLTVGEPDKTPHGSFLQSEQNLPHQFYQVGKTSKPKMAKFFPHLYKNGREGFCPTLIHQSCEILLFTHYVYVNCRMIDILFQAQEKKGVVSNICSPVISTYTIHTEVVHGDQKSLNPSTTLPLLDKKTVPTVKRFRTTMLILIETAHL